MSRELNEIMCIKHVAQCLTHEEHSVDMSQYYLLLFRLSDDVYKNFEDMETTDTIICRDKFRLQNCLSTMGIERKRKAEKQ